MIKKIGVLLVAGIITIGISGSCYGDELSELKEQLKAMQIKMQEQMKQMPDILMEYLGRFCGTAGG